MDDKEFKETFVALLQQMTKEQKDQKKVLIIGLAFAFLILPVMLVLPDMFVELRNKKETPKEYSWNDVSYEFNRNNLEKALEIAIKIKNKAPDNSVGYHQIGNILDSLGRVEEAEENFKKAYKLWPNENNFNRLMVAQKKIADQKKEAAKAAEK